MSVHTHTCKQHFLPLLLNACLGIFCFSINKVHTLFLFVNKYIIDSIDSIQNHAQHSYTFVHHCKKRPLFTSTICAISVIQHCSVATFHYSKLYLKNVSEKMLLTGCQTLLKFSLIIIKQKNITKKSQSMQIAAVSIKYAISHIKTKRHSKP